MCKNCAILLSLPAWECGLKFMETYIIVQDPGSLPAWECGLKSDGHSPQRMRSSVTPCVGVWIEICGSWESSRVKPVTPCVGVWIEIILTLYGYSQCIVTPCVGVWIEIFSASCRPILILSLPAWECGLKYMIRCHQLNSTMSLPAWECGLKSSALRCVPQAGRCHSLRGSVD